METKVGMKGFSLQSFWISCKKTLSCGRRQTGHYRLKGHSQCQDLFIIIRALWWSRRKADIGRLLRIYELWRDLTFCFIYILSHIKCCSSLYWFVFEIWCPIFVLPLKKLWKLILRSVITCNLWRPTSVIISLRMNIASRFSSVSMNTLKTLPYFTIEDAMILTPALQSTLVPFHSRKIQPLYRKHLELSCSVNDFYVNSLFISTRTMKHNVLSSNSNLRSDSKLDVSHL